MRIAAERVSRPGAQKSIPATLVAPVGGLNARDSIANMPPTDALALENWFPTTTSVDVRKGWSSWATFTGLCQTVMVYTGPTLTSIFAAVKNGSTYSIFDATGAGAVGTESVGGSTFALTGVVITGVGGQFSCTASSPAVVINQRVTISGVYGGTGSITGYANPTTYLISATNGSTTFTLKTLAGAAVVTTAGTPTGLTYTVAHVEALTNTRFDYVNFSNSGGSYLLAFNGHDNGLTYDGSTWTANGFTGGTPANYQSAAVYSNRVWVFERDTFNVWYGAVNAITGAMTQFTGVGSLFKLGGKLAAIITLTDNSAATLADYIGFLSTEGEIVAYTGDPATTFTLAAHFRIGRPVTVGIRTWQKWGVDAAVLCTDGLYPLRQALSAGRKIENFSVTDKIRNLINNDIQVYGAKYGWSVTLHTSGDKMIVNVPTVEDVSSYQYVMNTQTGAWTKFTGWTAFSFAVSQDTLWMGGNGTLVKADTTYNDGVLTITTKCRSAFNYFGQRGLLKQMQYAQPIFTVSGDYHITISTDVDFKDLAPAYLRAVTGGSGDPWGAGLWSARWSGNPVVSLKQYSVNGVGKALSLRISTRTDGVSLSWSATNLVFAVGGILS